MIKMRFAMSLVVAGIWAAVSLSSLAENKEDAALLAKSVAEASVSLDQGLKASEREGTPISAKYEMEDGALQLSVYTMKGDKFSEVIVDPKSGAIEKAEPITDADDLKHAKTQSQAMAKAKAALDDAVQAAVKANVGYRAVSVVPTVKSGTPVADITLMKGEAVKKVSKKLD